ncbi:hypothetical protein GCM10010278_85380 [Streptomyces melanogenes]|nr:hypothetical protein GCM10010278_85380 [Streptomyces melanogenes]
MTVVPSEKVWSGRAAMSLEDWIARELERAPEPSAEQRGALGELFRSHAGEAS